MRPTFKLIYSRETPELYDLDKWPLLPLPAWRFTELCPTD